MLCEQTTGLFQRAIMQSAPLGVRDGRDAMTAAMRSAASAATTGEVMDAQTAAAAAAARFGLIGRLPFGPIMGLDPLPAASSADARFADAARRIELLIGCHCIELPLLFDAPAWADAPMLGGRPSRRSTRRDDAPQLERLRSPRHQRTRFASPAFRIAAGQAVMASIAR
jgi:hypothetical protein